MIDYYSLPDEDLPMSMRVLRKILQERGWKAEKLCADERNDLILTRPDGKEIRIASSTPPTTTVFALHLADNKLASYALLSQIGVPQPETITIDDLTIAEDFLRKHGSIVIKPSDGAHGRGVTVGITEKSQLDLAIKKAVAASPVSKIAIAQPQLPTDELELRVICIDGNFIVAIARIPAQVTGDGQHSLLELVDIENTTIRTKPYSGGLAYIDRESAQTYLGERKNIVPVAGEKVQVVASCNVGQGGTAQDYSDQISDDMKKLAETIARVAELPVIGVDFYGDQVIEINACPSLYYPTDDESAAKAAEAYIDYLARI